MKRLSAYIIALLAVVSCTMDFGGEAQLRGRRGADEPMTFGTYVEPMQENAKSAYISPSFDDSKITSLTVAVYDRSSGELYGSHHFTSGFSAMEIPLRKGEAYDLYALANMGDQSGNVPQSRTAMLSQFVYTVPSYSDVNARGIPMTGRLENFTAGSDAGTTFILRRLFAKVTLNVATTYDGGTAAGVKVTSLRVGNGNGVLRAFGDSRAASAGQMIGVEDYMTNNAVNASSVVFYVPENMQGTIGSAASSRDKNPSTNGAVRAKKDLLTYVEVTVEAASAYYSGTVNYRSYIGADALSDFNVRGNVRYVWNMTLTEDGLIYDDWKIDNGLSDGRYLRILQDPVLVEAGDVVTWEDVLQTNMSWSDLTKTYAGTPIYAAVPTADGFTIKADAADGDVMTATFAPAHNSTASLSSAANFRVYGHYLDFDRETYAVNPRESVTSAVIYGDSYHGDIAGQGGIAPDGEKWTVTPPAGLPHAGSGKNYLDYSYDPVADRITWTPTMYAPAGDYVITASTADGKHSDQAVLRVNDTRWINADNAFGGFPQETFVTPTAQDISKRWYIGFAYGDMSVSDDTGRTTSSANYGKLAGEDITGEWVYQAGNGRIGYRLLGDYPGFTEVNTSGITGVAGSYRGKALAYTVNFRQGAVAGDYSVELFWKDSWDETLGDYTLKTIATLHILERDKILARSITLTPAQQTLYIGKTADIKATISPANADVKDVEWVIVSGQDVVSEKTRTSGNPSVITLNAMKPGNATIKAVSKDGSGVESGLSTVNVMYEISGLTVTPASASITIGQTKDFRAVATLAAGGTADVTEYCEWTSNNTAVATVSGGKATAVGAGSGRIIARYGNAQAYAAINVAAPEISAVEYAGDDLYILYNGQGMSAAQRTSMRNNRYDFGDLPLRVTYADGTSATVTASAAGATFTSGNTGIFTVSGYTLQSAARGTANLVVSVQGKQTSVPVHVSEIKVSSASIAIQQIAPTVSCTMIPYNSSEESACEVSWASENTALVKVETPYGSSTKVSRASTGSGSCYITATCDGQYGSDVLRIYCQVYAGGTVDNNYLEIIPEGPITISAGSTYQFAARFHTVENGVDDGGADVTPSWSVYTGTGCIQIGSDGIVTAIAAGTAKIRAYYEGYTAYATVNVTDDTVPDVITHYIEIIPDEVLLETGESLQMQAVLHTVTNGVDDGGVAVTPVWESSDPAVAAINGAGLLTSVSDGTAVVRARYQAGGDDCVAEVNVRVARQLSTIFRLALQPAETTIAEGATITYKVIRYADVYSGSTLIYRDTKGETISNSDVNWSVASGAAYATIAQTGVATGVLSGDAVVKAAYKQDSSVSATAILHVDVVFNVEPGSGDPGSGGGNY